MTCYDVIWYDVIWCPDTIYPSRASSSLMLTLFLSIITVTRDQPIYLSIYDPSYLLYLSISLNSIFIYLNWFVNVFIISFSALCWRQRRSYVSLLEGLPDGTYVFPEELEEIADILLEEYTARDVCSWLCDLTWHAPVPLCPCPSLPGPVTASRPIQGRAGGLCLCM